MKLTIKNDRLNRTKLDATLCKPDENTGALELKIASRGESYIGPGAIVSLPHMTRDDINTVRAICDAREAILDRQEELRATMKAQVDAVALLVPPDASHAQHVRARLAVQLAATLAKKATTPEGIVAAARTIMGKVGETA
jgi:hypothetical protein